MSRRVHRADEILAVPLDVVLGAFPECGLERTELVVLELQGTAHTAVHGFSPQNVTL